MLDNSLLRMQILPMLETAGLITQEQDPNDKRKILVFPTIVSENESEEKNSETEGGVNNEILSVEMIADIFSGTIIENNSTDKQVIL